MTYGTAYPSTYRADPSPAVVDQVRRTHADRLAQAISTGHLCTIPSPAAADHDHEIRLANEVTELRRERDDARGYRDDHLERERRYRELSGLEKYVTPDGYVSVRAAGAVGTADGSRFGRHSAELAPVDLAHPLDDAPAPILGSADAELEDAYGIDHPGDDPERARHAETFVRWTAGLR